MRKYILKNILNAYSGIDILKHPNAKMHSEKYFERIFWNLNAIYVSALSEAWQKLKGNYYNAVVKENSQFHREYFCSTHQPKDKVAVTTTVQNFHQTPECFTKHQILVTRINPLFCCS